MTVFMLALLGFPVFGGMGFFAKWYVLQAALQAPAPQTRLSVLLVLTTTVSAGYYLYVVMVMYMKPRPENAPPLARGDGDQPRGDRRLGGGIAGVRRVSRSSGALDARRVHCWKRVAAAGVTGRNCRGGGTPGCAVAGRRTAGSTAVKSRGPLARPAAFSRLR